MLLVDFLRITSCFFLFSSVYSRSLSYPLAQTPAENVDDDKDGVVDADDLADGFGEYGLLKLFFLKGLRFLLFLTMKPSISRGPSCISESERACVKCGSSSLN